MGGGDDSGERKHAQIDDAWDLPAPDDVVQEAESRELVAELGLHIRNLTSTQRDVLFLRLWEGLPYREIGDILGKSPQSCKMAFSRVISTLRNRMTLAGVLCVLLCDPNIRSHCNE